MDKEDQKIRTSQIDRSFKDTWETRSKFLDVSYEEFLKSDYWSSVKNKAKRRDNYQTCLFCGSNQNIDLHHTTYKWIGTKDELRAIIALCRTHHLEVHKLAKQKNISVRLASNILQNKYFIERGILKPMWTYKRDYLTNGEYKIFENIYPGKAKITKDFSLYLKGKLYLFRIFN